MFNRMFAGFLTLMFVIFIAVPHPAHAANAFTDGAVVRVQSSSVEAGWMTGRIRLDQNKCWMIHLDKPTRDHYTQLALLVIDELQVSHGAQWMPVAVKPVLQAAPAQCREYAND